MRRRRGLGGTFADEQDVFGIEAGYQNEESPGATLDARAGGMGPDRYLRSSFRPESVIIYMCPIKFTDPQNNNARDRAWQR